MSDDPTQLNDDDLTNIVRQHGVKTPATARVEKSVLEKIQKLEKEKSLDERLGQNQTKERSDFEGPEM